ncbi:protein FAM111A-like [Mastacembelus armatus]|uniref:Protein FAM111A-like n=1 Tax=Mastacembelus armatus TaxID=205130 RepID=A0A3Q3N7J0_9TELE|nr:protein FAM111A-like [Mastacembelus armatus]XP_026184958.1 protein FAM111A-like [Mastacembelus armatus]
MAQPLQTGNNGSVDNIVKKNTDHQDGETSQPPNLQPDAKEKKELHSTHSFEWCWSSKSPASITCNKAQTVEDLLKGSSEFRRIAEKNKTKELVIVRDGKAISSHFPCSLIKNERLILKYIKAANKPKQPCSGSVHPCRKRPAGELVMFHVLTTGGKDVVKIMRNPALRATVQEITIYAYQGEKVKQALKRDARFLKTIFNKNCALSHTSTEVNTEMSNLVDDLDGKTYKIILLNRSNPTESQSSSLDDNYIIQSESQRSESDENQDPSQQSATIEALNDNTSEKKPKLNQSIFREIPDSKQMRIHLSSEFKHLMKGMKSEVPKFSRNQNLLHVEYGKSAETCRKVKTMKRLMELSSSVCQVRFYGDPVGSGFLLVDKFVLTNAHVVKKFYNETTKQLDGRVTAHFFYEDLQLVGGEVEVEEVVGFEYGPDASGHQYDWVLLKLSADKKLPDGLLPETGFCPQGGAVCIIGHPDGGVKKIDPCLIVPSHDRNNVVERHYYENQGHVQLITELFFERVSESVKRHTQDLTYESCFYFGSSGSPVFDKHCKVVAMHSGGYSYPGLTGTKHSVIEYGHPLSRIIEHILVQMVERGRADVLKAYIDCPYPHHDIMMTNLKKLVESRNITAFRNALNSSVVKNDQSLKMFFDFFSQKEEFVPMDIDT